jgi:hypothetical protein
MASEQQAISGQRLRAGVSFADRFSLTACYPLRAVRRSLAARYLLLATRD